MKVRTIALGSSLLVAVSGGTTLYLAGTGVSMSVDRSIYYDQPKHPVTPEMKRRTSAEARKSAPVFEVKDSDGFAYALGGTHLRRPQFVYFVLDGCPCSVDAEPLFQSLWKHFNGLIEFIAVTDGDLQKAKTWKKQMMMPYPLAPDPKLEVIHAFGATNSVNSVLIDHNGRIVKMWPGYSQDLLADMNKTMAKTLEEQARPFDASYAPKQQATGCAFAPANP